MKRYFIPLLLLIASFVSASPSQARRVPFPYQNEPQEKAWLERNRTFAKLYLSRFERNVTPQILEFAMADTDQNADIRTRAIIALGRIEDPQAEVQLQKLLDQLQKEQSKKRPAGESVTPVDAVPLFRLKLALGRIRARELKGREKLDAIAQNIGLTWEQVLGFADQLKQPKNHRLIVESYQLEVVGEFFDVLRSMRRKGEQLDPVGAARLVYHPVLEPLLSSSHLTRVEEAEFWLQRSSAPSNVVFDPALVAGLGNDVKPIILKHLQIELQKSKDQPQLFHAEKYSIVALDRLFEAAAATGDLEFVSILKDFVECNDPDIKGHAFRALDALQTGVGTIILPQRPLSGI